MSKIKKQPFIDYKMARVLAFMRSFIVSAKYERDKLIGGIEEQIRYLQVRLNDLKTVSDDPDNFVAALDTLGFKDNIARLRHDAWEAGLTSTLFEKLENKDFWYRFTGFMGEPVQEEEVKNLEDDDKPKARQKKSA